MKTFKLRHAAALVGFFLLYFAKTGRCVTLMTGELHVGQEYSDNILLSRENEQEDFVTTIAPRLILENLSERLDLRLEGGAWHSAYVSHRELNDTDYDYSAQADYQVSELTRTSFSGSFAKDSRIDRDFETTGLILDLTSRHQFESEVSISHTLDEKNQFMFSYSFAGENYADLNADYTYHRATMTLVHNLNGLTAETIGWGTVFAGYYDYDRLSVRQLALQGGFEKRINETWRLNATAGPSISRTEYDLAFIPVETQWQFSGELKFSYTGERERATLALSQALSPSSGRQGTVQRTKLTASYSWRLTEDLRLQVGGSFIRNRAHGNQSAALDVNEHTYRFTPSLFYRLHDDLWLDFRYSYQTNEDSSGRSPAKRNQVLLFLTGQMDLTNWH